MIFYYKISSKNLCNAAKCIKGGENRILFFKDVEKTDGKAEMSIIYSALNNDSEKYAGVKSLSEFENDGESVVIGHKKGVFSKLKRDNLKIISIHCRNH